MIPSPNKPTVFYTDPDHAGIRLLILPMLGASYLLGYLIMRAVLNWLIPNSDWFSLLSCVGALPVGLLVAFFAEKGLRQLWHSGRQIALDDSNIELHQKGQAPIRIQYRKPKEKLLWSFPLNSYPRGGRERRVPASHHCLALQLRQDEARLILFAFYPAKQAQTLLANHPFHPINPTDVYDNSLTGRFTQPTQRPKIPPNILIGEDGKQWLAERARWQEGIELTPADFETVLNQLNKNS